MGTPCQIKFYDNEETLLLSLYRHSDGYPEDEGSGVLPDLLPFLRTWNACVNIKRAGYRAIRAVQYLCNKYDLEDRWYNQSPLNVINVPTTIGSGDNECSVPIGELGYGIEEVNVKYVYEVYEDRIEVYAAEILLEIIYLDEENASQ